MRIGYCPVQTRCASCGAPMTQNHYTLDPFKKCAKCMRSAARKQRAEEQQAYWDMIRDESTKEPK